MKEIKAIFRPNKLTEVLESLQRIEDLPGITVDKNVFGFGRSRRTTAAPFGAADPPEAFRKVKLELVVPDRLVEQVIRVIQECAHRGNPGDGKIFVYSVEDIVKIRTNERGEGAI
jgi:nitrogen regulatory protein P-II 1